MKAYGLLGRTLKHSFSKKYFEEKFLREGIIDCSFSNIELPTIADLPDYLATQNNLQGFAITIPYKEEVLPYLHELSAEAEAMQACNCVQLKSGKLIGHNTDYVGFLQSLQPLLQPHHKKALILGTGGAAKAVAFALNQLNITYTWVSRMAKNEQTLTYEQLSQTVFQDHTIIINTTPLGTWPNLETCAPIPYTYITSMHLMYDLVYNPATTQFLQLGAKQGATIKNGYEMLVLQAEANWAIWNS